MFCFFSGHIELGRSSCCGFAFLLSPPGDVCPFFCNGAKGLFSSLPRLYFLRTFSSVRSSFFCAVILLLSFGSGTDGLLRFTGICPASEVGLFTISLLICFFSLIPSMLYVLRGEGFPPPFCLREFRGLFPPNAIIKFARLADLSWLIFFPRKGFCQNPKFGFEWDVLSPLFSCRGLSRHLWSFFLESVTDLISRTLFV